MVTDDNEERVISHPVPGSRGKRQGLARPSRPEPREYGVVVVPSRVEEVIRIRKVVGALARLDGFSEEDAACIEIAVGEAAANAVRHGSPQGEADSVSVTYECVNHSCVRITVEDHGPGFDLEHWLDDVQLLTLSEGERGIILIASLMDEVAYERSAKGGRLRMTKRLPQDKRHQLRDTANIPPLSDAGWNTSPSNSPRSPSAS